MSMTMIIWSRNKPTNHKQRCHYCSDWMKKGEQQIVKEVKEWGYGMVYTQRDYWHPICAMKDFLSKPEFMKHFKYIYRKDLDAKSFKKAMDSRMWVAYKAHHILSPFYTLISLHLSKKKTKEFLEEVFTGITFDKVMEPV